MSSLRPARRRRFIARLRFWPEARERLDVTLAPANAFDLEQEFELAGRVDQAAAKTLSLAWSLVRPGPAIGTAERASGKTVAGASQGDSEIADLPPGSPMCVWRAQDGWVVIYPSEPYCWRTLCMTFLNRTVLDAFSASEAWAWAEVNELATTVLDTHCAKDIAGTCLTYGVPAAVVPGWLDGPTFAASRRLADSLAYAAVMEIGASTSDRAYR